MSREYSGGCHCGAIKFSFTTEDTINKGLKCTCSLCSRRGAVMSDAMPMEALKIKADQDAIGTYQFGDKTATHHFCRQCGIYTHHEPGRAPGHYRVNLACIDELDTYSMAFEIFDGKNLL